MKNTIVVLVLISLGVFLGCLGTQSGGSGTELSPSGANALVSGRVYFKEKQLYGGIAIHVKNSAGQIASEVNIVTDSNGRFIITDGLKQGPYTLSAVLGEAEVEFAKNVLIDPENPKTLPDEPIPLLAVYDIKIDNISSSAFKISFKSNRPAKATGKCCSAKDENDKITLKPENEEKLEHKFTVKGLKSSQNYETTIYLEDSIYNQKLELNGLSVCTAGEVGPTGLSVVINNGDFETTSKNVTLNLKAKYAKTMCISENHDMKGAFKINFSETYNFSFKSSEPGSKRVYVKFIDINGVESPVINDTIQLIEGGYKGVWINDGAALTNNITLKLKLVAPTAELMQVSDNESFDKALWEAFANEKLFTLTPTNQTDGQKIIYAKFKGKDCDENTVFTASILLDKTPPSDTSITINGGAHCTRLASVTLALSSKGAKFMKLSNSLPFAATQTYEPFKSSCDWALQSGEDGERTVYAMFADQKNGGNETKPVSASIMYDTTPPKGNTVMVCKSDDEGSETITSALVADLPVWLHFKIEDPTTQSAQYALTLGTTTKPLDSQFSDPLDPQDPHELANLSVGVHRIYARFSDEAGNVSAITKPIKLTVEGPSLIIEPKNVTLKSNETCKFTVTLKNTTDAAANNISFSIETGSGTIDSKKGIYTAPAPVMKADVVTIKAKADNLVSDEPAKIKLATQAELLIKNSEGCFVYKRDENPRQIGVDSSCSWLIKVLHGQKGISILEEPAIGGTPTVSTPERCEDGMLATITYKSPAELDEEKKTVAFSIKTEENQDNPDNTATFTVMVSKGATIFISSLGDLIVQRGRPLKLSAVIAGTASKKVKWKISDDNLASFNASGTSEPETTTTDIHEVTIYAAAHANENLLSPTKAKITAEIDSAASASRDITVYPPIKFKITPGTVDALPIKAATTGGANSEQGIKFEARDFRNNIDDAGVEWFFYNSAKTETEPEKADGKPYSDRGTLKPTDDPAETSAEYTRPAEKPSKSDITTCSDTVIILARSKVDHKASATAMVRILDDVSINLYLKVGDTENAEASGDQQFITEAEAETGIDVVREVGKRRFYASVAPAEIQERAVTWSIKEGAGGDYGKIDEQTGLYEAPKSEDISFVTVRATSKYDATKYTEVKVNLVSYWQRKNKNMQDEVNHDNMPITSLAIDPTTKVGQDYIVYAGTDRYGVWVATFSDVATDTSGGDWQPVSGLSCTIASTSGECRIQSLAINNDEQGSAELYAATANGVWFIPRYTNLGWSSSAKAQPLTTSDVSKLPSGIYTAVCYDTSYTSANDTGRTLIAATKRNVYRVEIDETCPWKYSKLATISYCVPKYRKLETRKGPVTAYSDKDEESETYLGGEIGPMAYDDKNNVLYFGVTAVGGGEKAANLCVRVTPDPNGNLGTDLYNPADAIAHMASSFDKYFVDSDGTETVDITENMLTHFVTLHGLHSKSKDVGGLPKALAVNSTVDNVVWLTTTGGVSRSVDSGQEFETKPIGDDVSSTNCRAIVVDKTNITNVMVGTEDGLCRSTDAGKNWKRIKTGLGDFKTIFALIQSQGEANARGRRKVWVGTTGGVFIGCRPLDLE